MLGTLGNANAAWTCDAGYMTKTMPGSSSPSSVLVLCHVLVLQILLAYIINNT